MEIKELVKASQKAVDNAMKTLDDAKYTFEKTTKGGQVKKVTTWKKFMNVTDNSQNFKPYNTCLALLGYLHSLNGRNHYMIEEGIQTLKEYQKTIPNDQGCWVNEPKYEKQKNIDSVHHDVFNTTLWALMVLYESGYKVDHPIVRRSLNWILSAKNALHSWSFTKDDLDGKVFITAFAIRVLSKFNMREQVKDSVLWLISQQNDDGSWGKAKKGDKGLPPHTAHALIAIIESDLDKEHNKVILAGSQWLEKTWENNVWAEGISDHLIEENKFEHISTPWCVIALLKANVYLGVPDIICEKITGTIKSFIDNQLENGAWVMPNTDYQPIYCIHDYTYALTRFIRVIISTNSIKPSVDVPGLPVKTAVTVKESELGQSIKIPYGKPALWLSTGLVLGTTVTLLIIYGSEIASFVGTIGQWVYSWIEALFDKKNEGHLTAIHDIIAIVSGIFAFGFTIYGLIKSKILKKRQ